MDAYSACEFCISVSLCAGKVILKHEDHVLWIESLLLYNLGPFSRLYDTVIRRKVGQAFSIIGNTVYNTLKVSSDLVRCAAGQT